MDKTQVGLVSFSDKATKEFDLGTYSRKEDLKQVRPDFELYPVKHFFVISYLLSD